MTSNARSLREVPRHELIAAALDLGIERPDRLSIEELQRQLGEAATAGQVGGRGWFSVAKHLVASVVEQGLNLPEAARVIRRTVRSTPKQKPPLPTVTLAQIYLAQRCDDRARGILEQVLSREPHNYKARELLERLDAGMVSEASQRQAVNGFAVGEQKSESAKLPQTQPNGARSEDTEPVSLSRIARSSAPPPSQMPAPGVARLAHGGARDALLLIRSADGEQLHVYWELSERTVGLEASEPVGVQLVLVTPSWDGAEESQWSHQVHEQRGVQRLAVGPSTVVRGALIQQGKSARVLAVASNRRLPQSAVVDAASEGERATASEPHLNGEGAAPLLGAKTLVQEFRPRQRCVDEDVVDRALAFLANSPAGGVVEERASA